MEKIDCIAFGPHPDDVELFCAGTLVKLKSQGYRTAIVDLTQGELSTNGDVKIRRKESKQAAKILNLDKRLNLSIPDGRITFDEKNRKKIVNVIRTYRPDICLVPYWEDRHPDHSDASLLIQRAVFDAGLKKIESTYKAHRPGTILYYMLHQTFDPTFVVDISGEIDIKTEAILAYASQFSQSAIGIQQTPINQTDFLESLTSRATCLGHQIGVKYGEGFYYKGMIKIDNIMDFFS